MAKQTQAQTQDMGSGSVPKLMFRLALPAVVAQVINMLYNVVDRIYIGHIEGVGAAALTGVGLFMPILLLINAFAMLGGAGGAPRAAIAMGQGDMATARRILNNCFSFLLFFSLVLTVVFYAAAPQLLVLFGASEVTLPYALEYARIYILGTVFVLLVMGLNPFITTQGFATLSMMTTVLGAVCNIVLDPIFIFVFDMGVRGAAIATVLSQAVSTVWILAFLRGKKTKLELALPDMKPQARILGPCLALGISPFVMMATESLLNISFNSSLARYGGDMAVGAMTIISSVSQLVMMPVQGICQGGQPIISYNFGAGKHDRVRKAFYCQFFSCLAYTTAFWLLLMLAPEIFARIFSSDAQLVEYTVWAMRIYMAGIFAFGMQGSCQQAFMALSQAKISLLLACLRKLILLIPLIFILPMFLQNKVLGVFLAEPVSDIIAAVVTAFMFFTRLNGILAAGPGGSRAKG